MLYDITVRNQKTMRLAMTLLLAACVCTVARSQDLLVPHEHHEWARFPRGSWKQVRQVTQSYKDGELISSITTTLTVRLKDVGDDFIVLERDAKSEVSGQVFEKPTREFRTGLNGQTGQQTATISASGNQKVVVLGKSYLCEVRQMKITDPPTVVEGKVFYNAEVAPFILRREYQFTPEGKEQPDKQMVAEVIAVDKPYPVLAEIKNVAFVLQKTTSADETIETVEAQCSEVPGFVVGTWVTSFDAEGNLKSKTVVQLLNYEVAPEITMPAEHRVKTGFLKNRRQRRMISDGR